ncbi:MAG TPA: L-histidine N(alpha)-methyltransferase, partial [Blastocatellia bacterium]|nr:L-histidine N(alpha)-methyltransferase [Blastocatellia bacterium]
AFVSRLKIAGCVPDDSGADYLSPERGGDFGSNTISPADEADIFDRGRFTEVIADSALSFGLSNINLYHELNTDLRQGGTIDLKYHYLGVTCASYWLALSRNFEYGHNELADAISRNFNEVIEACNFADKAVDLVSLGSGDGQIDARILSRITKKVPNFEYYYCVDISFELLQQAVAHIVQCSHEGSFAKKFRIKAIHGDITRLSRLAPIYTFDQSVNLFTLTGNTLGNYNEVDLLKVIREGMETDDLLFLDARLHTLDDWDGNRELTDDEKQVIMSRYNNSVNNQFAFGPVERATNTPGKDIQFGYEVNTVITTVPKALNLITYCTGVDMIVRSNRQVLKGKRLNLAATTLYSYNALEKWLRTKGFNLLWHKSDRNIGLFLLRKV